MVSSGQLNPQGPEGIVRFRSGMLRQWLSLSVSQTRPQKPLSVPISVDENVNGNRTEESGGQFFRSVQFLLERTVFQTPVSHSNIDFL